MEPDSNHLIHAPRVGDTWAKLMNAWAEQNPHLLSSALSPEAAFVQRRDVRDRVMALAPIFAQSQAVGARPSVTGVVWLVELYTASEDYPLSTMRQLGTTRATYWHHAATAYVNGATASVSIVPDSVLDPIARAWFAQHPGSYVASAAPSDLLLSWTSSNRTGTASTMTMPDSAFRARVSALYERMRTALGVADFHTFGAAFDSLGVVVGAHQ